MPDFKWVIFVLIALGVVWFITGGPERASSRNPFIHQPNPLGEGTTYTKKGFWNLFQFPFKSGNTETRPLDGQPETAESEDEERVPIDENTTINYSEIIELKKSSAGSTDPNTEYISIYVSNKATTPVIFNGWKIRSTATGMSVSIAKASYLPRLGAINDEHAIKANPGAKILITTGRSPIGVSFRLNKCTGYLTQFQKFYPTLPRQCPKPADEIPSEYIPGGNPNAFNDQCLDFIYKMGACRINTKSLPIDMQSQCQEFVTREINYNACVSAHSNETDFYSNEWRVYLSRDSELWKSRRETIELVDPDGNTVDSISY